MPRAWLDICECGSGCWPSVHGEAVTMAVCRRQQARLARDGGVQGVHASVAPCLRALLAPATSELPSPALAGCRMHCACCRRLCPAAACCYAAPPPALRRLTPIAPVLWLSLWPHRGPAPAGTPAC